MFYISWFVNVTSSILNEISKFVTIGCMLQIKKLHFSNYELFNQGGYSFSYIRKPGVIVGRSCLPTVRL